MGGRTHRDRLHRGINPGRRTGSGDDREMLGKLAAERGSGIEEHAVAVGQVAPDRARDDVTRSKLPARHAGHKARPVSSVSVAPSPRTASLTSVSG